MWWDRRSSPVAKPIGTTRVILEPLSFARLAATHDMKVKEEIERLAREYGKLKEPWRFVAR
jgi:hypothetical protein